MLIPFFGREKDKSIVEVYQFYNNRLKPLYVEIEARNKIPVELLFEIHAAFDHMKRIYVEGEKSRICCQKALSHLKRGLLDALKLKLKYFNIDIERLLVAQTDFSLVDNGKYIVSLQQKKATIIQEAKQARLHEGLKDIEKALESWLRTAEYIDEFESEFLKPEKIAWAKRKTFAFWNADFVRGVVAGVVSSGLVAFAIWFFNTMLPVL